MRMCVACRMREPQDRLIRVVVRENQVVLDSSGTSPGRGAYLHPVPDCVGTAVLRKMLPKALKARSDVGVTAVQALIGLLSVAVNDR